LGTGPASHVRCPCSPRRHPEQCHAVSRRTRLQGGRGRLLRGILGCFRRCGSGASLPTLPLGRGVGGGFRHQGEVGSSHRIGRREERRLLRPSGQQGCQAALGRPRWSDPTLAHHTGANPGLSSGGGVPEGSRAEATEGSFQAREGLPADHLGPAYELPALEDPGREDEQPPGAAHLAGWNRP
jgi:hypothetical protein